MIVVHDDGRELTRGGPLTGVLCLLPDLTDEQLDWLAAVALPHLRLKLAGCEPRVPHPDDPGPGRRGFEFEVEIEGTLQDRGPAKAPRLVIPLVTVIETDDADDEPDDPDRTALMPIDVFHLPRGD